MLLTEIAVQNVNGFPAAARLSLARGLNAVVTSQGELVRLVRALFFPGPDDSAVLCGGPAPRKAALTLHSADGTLWRLVRDFDAGRTLLRGDSSGGTPERVGDDPATIAALLRERAGLPPEEVVFGLLTLCGSDLPSRSAQKAAGKAQLSAYDQGERIVFQPDEARRKLPELRIELERAQRQEASQEALDGLQRQLEELDREDEPLRAAETEAAAHAARLQAMPQPGEGTAVLEAKVRRFPDLLARRDATLDDLRNRRLRLREEVESNAHVPPLWKEPLFLYGLAGGIALVALGIYLEAWWPWVLDIGAFGVAAFGAWRWVDRLEEVEEDRRRLTDMDEQERRIQKQFEQDAAPVYAAMRAFGVQTADDVLARLEEREMLEARYVAMMRDIGLRRRQPAQLERDQRRAALQSDIARREQVQQEIGYGRDVLVIRREIQACEEALSGAGGRAGWDPSDVLRPMVELAAQAVRVPVLPFMEGIRQRLAQYIAALTDNRFVGVRPGPQGSWHVVAASGASGPMSGLQPADRDLVFVGVRLAVVERVVVPLGLPLVFDEPSLLVDAPHRGLLVRMLKTLSAGTQVMVRAAAVPPPGVVDRVVHAGTAANPRAA